MNNRRISLFLVLLMLTALLPMVQADGDEGGYLEAQNLEATVDPINQTVALSWNNVDTFDFMLLDELKTTNYSLYRSDEPLNSSNYAQAELVRNSIQACTEGDSFTTCKNKQHVVVSTIPPMTDGNFYYGVISIFENGNVTSNLTAGISALVQPVYEYGSPISSPYSLQANYVVETSTTELTWIDATRVDASLDSNHSTSIWSHSFPANFSNWETLNKTQVGSALQSGEESYEIVHSANLDRSHYYSVLHSFAGQEDTRFLSGNTLTESLVEDNIGSLITGTLQATFNASSSHTMMNWSGSIIEDATHTLHIWRSTSPITDLSAQHVEEIVQLPANTTHYNYTVALGFSGQAYYLVTLSDELGNDQTNLTSAPQTHLYESTLSLNQNIVTDLSASHESGTTHLSWTDLENHSEATYQIWRSLTGEITSTNFGTSAVVLLATVDAGVEQYDYVLALGISQDAWYAVTAIASFGTQNTTTPQTNISSALNSLDNAVLEDTKSPLAPSELGAVYHVNGTTEITWIGDGLEQGTTWKIYRNIHAQMAEESYWELVGQVENSGTTQRTLFVTTLAQYGESFTTVYAVSGTDAFGNTVKFQDWTLSSPVLEDRKSPNVQMKLFDSEMNVETSRWFDGGETSTFSHLAAGTYTLKFTSVDDAISIQYTLSTDDSTATLNLAQDLSEIEIVLSQDIENITVSFIATDLTGNTATFSALFCTTCLIQADEVDQIVEPSDDDEASNVEGEDDSTSNEPMLIGLCIALVLVVLFLALRSPKTKKTLSGLPSKSEDVWVDKYVSEK